MIDPARIFTTFPMLETKRCLLREVTREDAPEIFRYKSDPRVNKYVGQPPMASLEEAVRRVDMLRLTFQSQGGLPWAIISRQTGKLIGTFVFWNLNLPDFRAEIGYELAPEWWGKGIITEVIGTGLKYGFNSMGLNRIEAQTDPKNIASYRVLEKLGFVREGYLREYYYDPVWARFTDNTIYALLKSAWQKQQEN